MEASSSGELPDRLGADRREEVDQGAVWIAEEERSVAPRHRCRLLNKGIANHLHQLSLRRSRRPVTASQLAAELEVSQRSVYRDIADLIGQRVPIRGEAGIGYVLDRDFDKVILAVSTLFESAHDNDHSEPQTCHLDQRLHR